MICELLSPSLYHCFTRLKRAVVELTAGVWKASGSPGAADAGTDVGFGCCWILVAARHQSRARGRLRLVVVWCAAAAGETVWRPLLPASTDWGGRLRAAIGRPRRPREYTVAPRTTIAKTNSNCAINIMSIYVNRLPCHKWELNCSHSNQPPLSQMIELDSDFFD